MALALDEAARAADSARQQAERIHDLARQRMPALVKPGRRHDQATAVWSAMTPIVAGSVRARALAGVALRFTALGGSQAAGSLDVRALRELADAGYSR